MSSRWRSRFLRLVGAIARRRAGGGGGGGNTAPAFTSLPIISDSALMVGVPVGFVRGTVTGTPAPTLTQQWYRAGVAISGATGNSYTPGLADVGQLLTVRETATNLVAAVQSADSNSRLVSAAPTELISDVGDAGWTDPRAFIVPASGAPSTWFDNAQPGSRFYFVDGEAGTDPATLELCKDQVYFHNGTALVDRTGATAPASGPHAGVPYGDPMNPGASVKAFKTWAITAPKSGATESLRSTVSTAQIAILNMGTSSWRFGKPDWWLFKRGAVYSMYDGLRSYLDAVGRGTQALASASLLLGGLRTLGGPSHTNRSVLGAYGPVSAGRAEIVHPYYQFLVHEGEGRHQFTFGLYLNGSRRDRKVRPVDWAHFTRQNLYYDAGGIGAIGPLNYGHAFEDVHWSGCSNQVSFRALETHAVKNPQLDFKVHRCLIDSINSTLHTSAVTAYKGSGDADQVIAANTQAVVTWPCTGAGFSEIDTNNAFNPATGVMTMALSGFPWSFWPLMDVQATIAVGGALRVSLFKNGAEVAFYTLPGTGVTNDTYYCARALHPTLANQSAGSTYDIRISSAGATGDVVVKGAGTARLVVSRFVTGVNYHGTNGMYVDGRAGTSYERTETVLLLNGFMVNPRDEPTLIPTAATPWFNYSTRNHNDYLKGYLLPNNAKLDGCVSMIGAAGDVIRHLCSQTHNVNYNGYVSVANELDRLITTTQVDLFRRNAYLRFMPEPGTGGGDGAHPGWGIMFANGLLNTAITDNDLSDYAGGSRAFTVGWGIRLVGQVSPYWADAVMTWVQDVVGTLVDGNRIDSTSTYNAALFAEPYHEGNGSDMFPTQWQVPVAGFNPDVADPTGQVLTCTPLAGYSGTPSYQWVRYPTAGSGTYVVLTGETGPTYTMTIDDWGTVFPARKYRKAMCLVTGITWPTGRGITGTVVSNNVTVKPAARPFSKYYAMDTVGGPQGAPVYASVPLASDTTFTNNQAATTPAAAAALTGGTNWQANIKTHMQGLGYTVSSIDGFPEYVGAVLGPRGSERTQAFRRGRWDSRYLRGLLNHIRAGRGGAVV